MNINKDITLIAISDIRLKATIKALKKSNKNLNPIKTILFTSKSVFLKKSESKIIQKIKIGPIKSIKNYSDFVIYELFKFIETSHILIVQWDGYILNKREWNLDFLKYDYIGAPFIPRDIDKNYSIAKNGNFFIIGNGGFSLRSKKLLEAPSKYKLLDDKKFTNFHEDGFFSVLHREFLELKGFSWAPFEIAEKFSIESPISFQDLDNLPFGFHGKKVIYLLIFRDLIRFFRKIKNLKVTFLKSS